jgi:hypothetical protein
VSLSARDYPLGSLFSVTVSFFRWSVPVVPLW